MNAPEFIVSDTWTCDAWPVHYNLAPPEVGQVYGAWRIARVVREVRAGRPVYRLTIRRVNNT